MQLQDKRIVLTGATGGIGKSLAIYLAKQGTRIGLVGTKPSELKKLVDMIRTFQPNAIGIAVDITTAEGQNKIISEMHKQFGGIDILINNAGITEFTEFSAQQPEVIERIIRVNTVAPMQLTRRVLPEMIERGFGQIVNVGSTFGSIGFAYFSTYSSSKFAMRGFSESLRRELASTGVNVTYVAPRAVKTNLNNDAVNDMAKVVKMNMDQPAAVASKIVKAIQADKKDVYLGFPESLFVRINSVLPRLVDLVLRKQNSIIQRFTRPSY